MIGGDFTEVDGTSRNYIARLNAMTAAAPFSVTMTASRNPAPVGQNFNYNVSVTNNGAASCSFLTPLEPACVLIYTPGRYRFFDFFKVGSILTIAVFAVVMLLVPYFWPLK
jgi:hypothetical protein